MLNWLIETEQQLREFSQKNYNEVFLEPIYSNNNIHPALNELIAFYIRPINEERGIIVNIQHNDGLQVDISLITDLLQSYNEIYVLDRKSLLYYLPLKNIIDCNYEQAKHTRLELDIIENFYQKFGDKQSVNQLIPLTKWYEYCENLYNNIKLNPDYRYKLSNVFFFIEKNGIKTDKQTFNQYFEPTNPDFSIQDDIIYTQYNLKTTTGRPSNSFNGINFAALNKENGCRKSFIPKNDYFLEFDLTAFHPYLVSRLIGFDFGDETPYEYFSREANIPTDKAKIEFIKQMYGGVFEKYENIEFFNKLKQYLNDRGWNGKQLSHEIQNLETHTNVEMIWEMLKLLKGKNTQIVLYVYDSILLDIDKSEEYILEDIKQIFNKNNLKYKTKQGPNYDFHP